MLKKSQHTVSVVEAFEGKQLDLDNGLTTINNNKAANTVNPFTTMCNNNTINIIKRLVGMPLGVQLIEFKSYEKNEFIPEYSGALTLEKFKELLINNEPVVFDKQEADVIQQYFDNINLNNDAIFNIEFISSKGLMKLVKKTIKKKKNKILIPYFNEKTVSVFEKSEDLVIYGDNHVVFEDNDNTYLKINHYSQLGLQVYTTINPEENKVTPAVIVEDMNGNALEVHCCYKNDYIAKEILNELKPNILKEDFRSAEYFTVRDIEFLDMILI
jgi:hypothetical protein